MTAAQVAKPGADFQIVEREIPEPDAGQVLIKVKACALNRLDLWVRQGVPAYPVKLPHILGSDICGVLVDGEVPTGLAKGDDVIVYPGLFNPDSRAASLGSRSHSVPACTLPAGNSFSSSSRMPFARSESGMALSKPSNPIGL